MATNAGRSLEALELPKYHGYGMDAPLQMLKDHLFDALRVQLFPSERIAYLDIRFGDLVHRCTEQEWSEFLAHLSANGVPISKPPWWQFWRR